MLTRQQGQTAFTHILEEVFQLQDNEPLYKALITVGCNDIRHLINMSLEDIDALQYINDDNNEVPVPSHARALLRILKAYHIHRIDQGDPIGDAWISITAEQFDSYRISSEYNLFSMGMMSPTGTTRRSTTAASPSQSRTRDPVSDFKKGIKRDPTLFPIFKLDKQWVAWQRSVIAQARAQDVADVFDPTHCPTQPDEKLLFEEKQKYVYAVFEQRLLTDKGKALV
jgi:hypothetical protein